MLFKHREVVKRFGCITGYKHNIKLKPGTKLICFPSRCRSPKEEELDKECKRRLIDIGVFEYSMSPWEARNVFVPKKDCDTRVPTEFRALNGVTKMNAFPMEDVHLTLDWLSSKEIYSVFDLDDGLFRIGLDDVSKPPTVVRTVLGVLQYTRLPQRLKNSPSTF